MMAERPEVTHCKLRLQSVWLAITHKDPLASESKVAAAVEKLQGLAEIFFEVDCTDCA